MTLILRPDLDMVKMYLHTKNEVSMSKGPEVIAWTDRNTDRHTDMTENITYPHTRLVTTLSLGSLCLILKELTDNFWECRRVALLQTISWPGTMWPIWRLREQPVHPYLLLRMKKIATQQFILSKMSSYVTETGVITRYVLRIVFSSFGANLRQCILCCVCNR